MTAATATTTIAYAAPATAPCDPARDAGRTTVTEPDASTQDYCYDVSGQITATAPLVDNGDQTADNTENCSADPGENLVEGATLDGDCSVDDTTPTDDSSTRSRATTIDSLTTLRSALEDIPSSTRPTTICGGLGSDNSRFGAQDLDGRGLDVLDIIADPAATASLPNTYLGVHNGGEPSNAVKLEQSCDLYNWQFKANLAPRPEFGEKAASNPTLKAAPGGGFLLAYEAVRANGRTLTTGSMKGQVMYDHYIHVSYYANEGDLLTGAAPAAWTRLKRRFGRGTTSSIGINGTPDIKSIAVVAGCSGGATNPDCLDVSYGYHYFNTGFQYQGKTHPVDRNASGTFVGFGGSSHNTTPTTAVVQRGVDNYLSDHYGYLGNHGQRRDLRLNGHTFRIIEAAKTPKNNFATFQWFLFQADGGPHNFSKLDPQVEGDSRQPTAIGNPTMSIVPRPDSDSNTGDALAVTGFAFSGHSGSESAGEFIYYHPLG